MKKKLTVTFVAAGFVLTLSIIYLICTQHKIDITAHRGDHRIALENTLASFSHAIENNADYIELDITETKDGKLVVLHDPNLKRMMGHDINIWDITSAELEAMKNSENVGAEPETIPLPYLEDVFKLCQGRIKLNLEVKYNGHESSEFLTNIVKAVEQNNYVEDCVITSFHYEFVNEVKKMNPAIKTGYIFSDPLINTDDYPDVDLFSVYYEILNEDLVKRIHRQGKKIHVWTVNEKLDIIKCRELKVDNIITNDIEAVERISR